jgi:hypothetical protein
VPTQSHARGELVHRHSSRTCTEAPDRARDTKHEGCFCSWFGEWQVSEKRLVKGRETKTGTSLLERFFSSRVRVCGTAQSSPMSLKVREPVRVHMYVLVVSAHEKACICNNGCICVRIRVCYVCECVCVHARMCVAFACVVCVCEMCLYVCVYCVLCVNVCVCVHVCMCVYCVCVYVCLCVCMYCVCM